MKVLYLSLAKIPSKTAHSVHIMKICSSLSDLVTKLDLFCSVNSEANLNEEEINDYYGTKNNFGLYFSKHPKNIFSNYTLAFKSLLLAIKIKPDLIISRFFLGGFLSSIFFKTLIEIHAPINKNSRLQINFFKFLKHLPNFYGLIVITQPLKKIFEDEGIPEDKIFVLPDGADYSELDIINKKGPLEKLNVGYAGHLYKGRGIKVLFEIAKRCEWVKIWIAGGNEKEIEMYKNKLLDERITNIELLGFINPNEVNNFFKRMDVLIAPYQKKVTIQDGFNTEKWMSPLKVFEYMNSRKPIICSNISVLREVLENGNNCLLCEPDDINEWIQCLKDLKSDYALREKIAKNAALDLKNKFSWEVRAKKILDLIK